MRSLALISLLFAQTVPQFEIADVHPSPPRFIGAVRTGWSHGIYELRQATMVDLIRTAWNVDADRVLNGPEWLESDRFDVIAAAPPGSTADDCKAMLRALLEDRFNLAVHNGTRDLPVYALRPGRKPELTPSTGTEDSGCRLQPNKNPQAPVILECRNISTGAFADQLPSIRAASGYLFNYRAVDQTGLKGTWNFDLKWTPRVVNPKTAPTAAITLFDAVEKQLGLKLELTKIPAPAILVDRVNRQPTPNLPGAADKLPVPPMKFEVAEIKPAAPDAPASSVAVQRGGLVRIHMTLKGLIQEAWGDYNGGLIAGLSKPLESSRWSIVAKAPATDLSSNGAVFNGIDIDSMRLMLRALLVERFGLVAHTEERPVSGYALVAARPKLRKADPANRPGCKEGPGADGKDPRIRNPIASRLVTCRNVTIAELANQIPAISAGYMHDYPKVQDATGIAGRYDITLNFSPWNAIPNNAAPGSGSDGVASEPNGVISLYEAVQRQLGLKLEVRKVPAPVVVIDHVNETPSEN